VVKHGYRTFDIDIKMAQLKRLRIPCSVLLVDECQDLDECQVDWIESQKHYGTHIFFVGDSAQCIYGFRMAKSTNVMKLDCIDTKLTQSFRFGPNIAKVANIPLFAKEKSEQTTSKRGERRLWIPYRVQGVRKEEDDDSGRRGGVVTTESLLKDWQKYKPLTFIGSTNKSIMVKAMDLLGLEALKVGDCEGEDENKEASSEDVNNMIDAVENIPKFHINGRGDSSGMKKFYAALRQVRYLYELYSNKDDETGEYIPMVLPVTYFKEFANEGPVTWPMFREIIDVKEIDYGMALSIIATYKQNTLQAIDAFESQVMTDKYSKEEADIILTTCHSAKGLEWDHVEVCDDLLDLPAASFTDSGPSATHHPSFLKAMPGQIKSEAQSASKKCEGVYRKSWQFILSDYQDGEINKLYVALTRAKKTLSVPPSIKVMLEEFDKFHFLVGTYKNDALAKSSDSSTMLIKKKDNLTKGEVWNLYHDLCHPLRNELEVPEDSMILPHLFPDDEIEPVENKIEEEQEAVKLEAVGQPDGTTPVVESVADLFDC